jgi:predicted outer membrane repeat protein
VSAIGAAAPGSTLVVSGTCVGTITITKDLTLRGRGHRPTLDGAGVGPVVVIPGDPILLGAKVRIIGLIITRGASAGTPYPAAGIVNGGDLRLRDSWVVRNAGDGIYMNGPMRMVDAHVDHNTGNGLTGGGELPMYRVSLLRSTVSHNGGLGVRNNTKTGMTISYSRISGNGGGGIVNNGGIVFRGFLTLDHSRVTHNYAPDGAGLFTEGNATIRDSVISGNTAANNGGGILVQGINLPALTVIRSTIRDNTAAAGDGGGIYVGHGMLEDVVLTLRHVTFHNNTPDDCNGC